MCKSVQWDAELVHADERIDGQTYVTKLFRHIAEAPKMNILVKGSDESDELEVAASPNVRG